MTVNGVGESFGSYRLLSRLGEGGMGVVHVAEMIGEAGFRKRVAIKRMHERYRNDPRLLEFFAAEARTNARIDHPNAVHVLEFGLEPEPHIVMEYVEGVSLRALLWRYHERAWAMDLRASTLIAAEAALGLDVAHRLVDEQGIPLGVVHRDISPSNVLISKEGTVKISDFGLVMVADNPFTAHSDVPVGKPHYMAPEQAEGQPLDARADVFALGLVLWESLAQRQMLPPNDFQTARKLLAACSFHPPSRFNPQVPPELDWITAGCLHKNPSERWASAEALSLALRQLLHSRGQGFDRIQLASLVRGAFPERGWGQKQPAQPPPQPTKSQIARLPLAPPVAVQDVPATDEMAGPQEPQTSPGLPEGMSDLGADEDEPISGSNISGYTVRRTSPRGGTNQFLIAQLERSMWLLRSSRPLEHGSRLRGPIQGQLIVIVDGGELFSGGNFGGVVAVDTLAHYALSVMPWTVQKTAVDVRQLGERLHAAAQSCADQLRLVADPDGQLGAEGVSLRLVWVRWPDLLVVQSGIGHCALLRHGVLGHVAGEAVEGRSTVGRALITAKSSAEGVVMDLHHVQLLEGDTVLVCSGGFAELVSDERITDILSAQEMIRDVDACAEALAREISAPRSRDVTVVVARY